MSTSSDGRQPLAFVRITGEETSDELDVLADAMFNAMSDAIGGPMNVPAKQRCPNCGARDATPILYGLPGPEMVEASETQRDRTRRLSRGL